MLWTWKGDEIVPHTDVIKPRCIICRVYSWTKKVCSKTICLQGYFFESYWYQYDSENDSQPIDYGKTKHPSFPFQHQNLNANFIKSEKYRAHSYNYRYQTPESNFIFLRVTRSNSFIGSSLGMSLLAAIGPLNQGCCNAFRAVIRF